eukprot:10325344-Ditylum_brightwellii.AAC.1
MVQYLEGCTWCIPKERVLEVRRVDIIKHTENVHVPQFSIKVVSPDDFKVLLVREETEWEDWVEWGINGWDECMSRFPCVIHWSNG